jgi:hypothetical protein
VSAIDQPSAYRASNAAAGLSLAASGLTELWRMLKKGLFDPYRPELHYMRGPGPKWRQKHARADPFDGRSGIAHCHTTGRQIAARGKA